MNFAYQEFQKVTFGTNTTPEIKNLYADRYRNACNVPHYTPEDIFRNLYGYACGDNNQRGCAAGKAVNTGTCKFGVKKRQYILDTVVETAAGIPSSVREFSEWHSQAMILAQFHYAFCLPPDATTCNDPFTDPVRKEIANNQMLAFEEAAGNLNREVRCIEDITFVEYLKGDAFYKTHVPDIMGCFQEKGGGQGQVTTGHKVNSCMAKKTREALIKNFPSKDWTVVVYSKQNEGVKGSMRSYCNFKPTIGTGEYENGCVNADVDFNGKEIENETKRTFHLMFRSVGENPDKDYSMLSELEPDKPYTITIGSKVYSTLPELLNDYGVRAFGDTLEDYRATCWGHPMFPYREGVVFPGDRVHAGPAYQTLAAGHGYIAFKRDQGMDYAFELGNFTKKSDTIFYGNNKPLKVFNIPSDKECLDENVGTEETPYYDMIY